MSITIAQSWFDVHFVIPTIWNYSIFSCSVKCSILSFYQMVISLLDEIELTVEDGY